MRVWIDPGRAAALDLTAGEIVAALRAQNVQVAAGTLGQPPYATGSAFQLNVETQGRLDRPAAVRQRRHPHRCRRPPGRACRTSPGSSSAPPTMPPTPICRASRPSSSACSSAPARTRSPPPKRSRPRWTTLSKSFPHGPRISRHLQPDRIHRPVDRRGRCTPCSRRSCWSCSSSSSSCRTGARRSSRWWRSRSR